MLNVIVINSWLKRTFLLIFFMRSTTTKLNYYILRQQNWEGGGRSVTDQTGKIQLKTLETWARPSSFFLTTVCFSSRFSCSWLNTENFVRFFLVHNSMPDILTVFSSLLLSKGLAQTIKGKRPTFLQYFFEVK